MNIHILGVCGTFMAGIAILAKQQGHRVVGSDEKLLPPMSTQLYAENIELCDGYDADYIAKDQPDLVIVGNVIKRGNPALEYILNQKIPYISGPEWLYQEILSKQKKVLAVAGTHGKTTTTSILTWILEKTGHNPGFLIGGVPENFGFSARIGGGDYFVIEADEYDTAFFDKRSKFVHYHPDVLIINNLEYDHADIFPNLQAIQQQFHQMIRMLPQQALIIRPAQSQEVDDTIQLGCWSQLQTFSINKAILADWKADMVRIFVLNTAMKMQK
jgi:UDP-N-acetylmuramate: L-alanyl-gamma-D-glutamyl-meso-diaminopimelate ligase